MSNFLAFTHEEGLAALKEANSASHRVRDGRICVCGHSAQAHAELTKDRGRQILRSAGVNVCRPSKLVCPCEKLVPVLDSSNSRYFIRRTLGPGVKHALSLGLTAALEAGAEVTWTIDQTCWRCKAEGVRLLPVAVTDDGKAATVPMATNALVCDSCLFTLQVAA